MKKHKLLRSQLKVSNEELVHGKEYMMRSIKESLIESLVRELLDNHDDLLNVHESQDFANQATLFRLNLILISENDYRNLELSLQHLNAVKSDGTIIHLSDLI